jgi:Putative lumazine-binding
MAGNPGSERTLLRRVDGRDPLVSQLGWRQHIATGAERRLRGRPFLSMTRGRQTKPSDFCSLFPRLAILAVRESPYHVPMALNKYATEYDSIVEAMQMYIDAARQGKSEVMRPAFHPGASFFGYAGGSLAAGMPFLFDWIDKNGPAPDIQPRFVSVDILESIAVVRLEVGGWSGALSGSGVEMSDVFTLLKTPEGWRIIQKAFHWHA